MPGTPSTGPGSVWLSNAKGNFPPARPLVNMEQVDYRGRKLQILEEDGYRVVIFMDGKEMYSTAPHFEKRDDAIMSAKNLVDAELAGHRMTRPT